MSREFNVFLVASPYVRYGSSGSLSLNALLTGLRGCETGDALQPSEFTCAVHSPSR
jgi:hypothetical protein